MMNVTVLGCNGPYPGPGGACSSYLLDAGGQRFLLDAGSGSMSNLMKVIDPVELDGIILSHLHWDHLTDIPVLNYYLMLSSKAGRFNGKVDIYMPLEPAEIFSMIDGFEFFETHILTDDTKLVSGECTFSFKKMTHPIESYAIRVTDGDRTFVYSGDSTYNGLLLEFARGCELLLADSAFLERQLLDNSPHMSAAQCAGIAMKAGAERLALTHLNPSVSSELYEKEARVIFKESHAVSVMEVLEV